MALAKSLGASALCTDAFLADDPNEGAKLQTFVQTAKPVKVIIGRRAFDDVLERLAGVRRDFEYTAAMVPELEKAGLLPGTLYWPGDVYLPHRA